MEKWRGEELVAHGDDKARERLVANWESSIATGKVVASRSPTAIFPFFFYFSIWWRIVSSGFRRQERQYFFIFILIHGDGCCLSPLGHQKNREFGFIFLNEGDSSVGSPLVAMFLNLNSKVAMGL